MKKMKKKNRIFTNRVIVKCIRTFLFHCMYRLIWLIIKDETSVIHIHPNILTVVIYVIFFSQRKVFKSVADDWSSLKSKSVKECVHAYLHLAQAVPLFGSRLFKAQVCETAIVWFCCNEDSFSLKKCFDSLQLWYKWRPLYFHTSTGFIYSINHCFARVFITYLYI